MKPILFNAEMVRAILDGRKTVTRRVVKKAGGPPMYYDRDLYNGLRHELNGDSSHLWAGFYKDCDIFYVDGEKHIDASYFKAPYKPGDILYVRETWQFVPCTDCLAGSACTDHPQTYDDRSCVYGGCYLYRADYPQTDVQKVHWRPSIHMPREASRIFLRVTDVRVERLQDITEEQAKAEGVTDPYDYQDSSWYENRPDLENSCERAAFSGLWDSTIKPADREKYGWDANPWVWVISFERISKEEAYSGEP